MRSICAEFLKINNIKRLIRFFMLILLLFTISGCGGDVVKIIIIPAPVIGVAWVYWFFIAAGVSSIVEPRKTYTPEQIQQQKITNQQREAEQAQMEEMDLPVGLNVSDTNYIRFGTDTLGPNVTFNSPPNPGTTFHIYSKYPRQSWEEIPIVNTYTDNMSDGTFRIILHTNDIISSMGGRKTIIMWN
jgi:hypothetical protein